VTTFEFEIDGRRKVVEAEDKKAAYVKVMEDVGDDFALDRVHTIRLLESYEGRREIPVLRVNGMRFYPYRYDLSEELGRFAHDSVTHGSNAERRAAGDKILVALEKYFAENHLTVVPTKE